MRKVLMAGVSVAALALATTAASAGGYVSIFGGYGWGGNNDAVSGWSWEAENSYCLFSNNCDSWWEGNDFAGSVGDGAVLGVALGTNLTDNVRVEGEVSWAYLKTETSTVWEDGYTWNYGNSWNVWNHYEGTSDSHLSAIFVMANLWYDFKNSSPITPYIGGGAGVAFLDGSFSAPIVDPYGGDPTDRFDFEVDPTAVAVQLGAGVKYAMTSNLDLDIGYRYKRIQGVTTTQKIVSEVEYDDEFADYGVTKDTFNIDLHTVQAGITWHF